MPSFRSSFCCTLYFKLESRISVYVYIYIKVKVKWSHYRPDVAQRVGRAIALLFHDCGTRRRWVVSSTPRPHFTPGKDPVPIVQEAGWAPGPVWTDGKSCSHRDLIPGRPDPSQLLYRLSYPAHIQYIYMYIYIYVHAHIQMMRLSWLGLDGPKHILFIYLRYFQNTETLMGKEQLEYLGTEGRVILKRIRVASKGRVYKKREIYWLTEPLLAY